MPAPGPDKALCGAQRPNQPKGVTCRQVAGARTDHVGVGRCWRHGGATRSHVEHGKVELARAACDRLGLRVEGDPGEMLLQLIWETRANVEFYGGLVSQLPTHPEPDLYIVNDDDPNGHWERGEPGVYGRSYHASGLPTGEAKPHVLVSLYNEERDRLKDVIATALKANVDERRVRMAENDAAQILGAQVKALIEMGMGDRLEEFRLAFVRNLRVEPVALGAASSG